MPFLLFATRSTFERGGVLGDISTTSCTGAEPFLSPKRPEVTPGEDCPTFS